MNKLTPAVMAAFKASKTVALEFTEGASKNVMLELGELVAKKGVYTDGNGLQTLLNAAELDTLRKTMAAEGIPAEQAHIFKPGS